MSKSLSLLFAVSSVILLILTGASLSYRQPWLALLFIVLYIFMVGAGFIVKAKIRRKQQND
ncbi:DUF5325 family protein [Marinicrinis lubricantis]|uniref:DUF5325 family protein n=1 Tax=Marinicrinis lubricantis TaxID=2086470 RepID=A0ABW1INP4_9BACL